MIARNPSASDPLLLTEASVQELQLELIRRRRFNNFDGPRVVDSLRRHRDLWRAVLMDRLGFVAEGEASLSSLIKLRDLPLNYWNVDDLYILTETRDQCVRLMEIAEQEAWQVDNVGIMENADERANALGVHPPDQWIVWFWWD